MLDVRRSMILSLLLVSLIFILTPERSYSESTLFISMDFQNANLKDVLKVFSQQSGLNFIASEDVKDRKLTLYFEKVPVQDALNTIISANNLSYEQVEGTNIFIVKESGEVKVETVTQVFPLKYARVAKFGSEGEEGGKGTVGIKLAVEKLLSEKGRVAEDLRTNSLIVMDFPQRVKVIEGVIAKLDVSTPQVMIEVEMIDATKKVVDSLGVDWSGVFGAYTGPQRVTNYPFSQIFPPGPHGWEEGKTGTISTDSTEPTTTGIIVGKFNMTGLTAALKALTTDTNTKYLARPRILTLNNEAAEIKIETDEAISSATTTATVGGVGTVSKEVKRANTGVSLKVTPQINSDDGYITMLIEPSVSEALTGTISDGTQIVKDPETRSAKTTVRLRDGETIVIGGLIRNRSSETIKKIPLLGDIPVLGFLFRHRERTEPNDRELVVFITPHIIKEAEAQLAKLPIPKEIVPEEVIPEEIIPEEAEEYLWSRQDEIEAMLDRLEER